jgi:hypothetical protein
LIILEQMQHVLGAQERPVCQQPMVFVRQSATTTDGDQSRITLFRQDRHAPIPTIHGATTSYAKFPSAAKRATGQDAYSHR